MKLQSVNVVHYPFLVFFRRLNIAYTDMMPSVRHGLFSEST